MRNSPLQTLQKLIKERYSEAKAVFWSGSVSQNQGTEASDLDIVIVFESIPNAYREAFIYEDWPIDAFMHDPDTLPYFFKKIEANDGRPALIQMIVQGQLVFGQQKFAQKIKRIAKDALDAGPEEWSQAHIERERFLITDNLHDIIFPKNREEQLTSAVHLFEPLIQFYFRAQKKWAASGKTLIRNLKMDAPDLALECHQSFEQCFQTGVTSGIETLVQKILAPYGGLHWDGFRSDAPREWKTLSENTVLEELKAREPIFHHPDTFGKSKQDILAQMCDDFWEVGGSGNAYTKQDVIETLAERYNDPNYEDVWETSEFKLTQIAENNYLLTYILIQNKTRITRRSTIWRYCNGQWIILFHQGTIVEEKHRAK